MENPIERPRSQPLIHESIVLRPLVEEDIPSIFHWRNDPEWLYLWSPARRLLSFSEFQSWLNNSLKNEVDMWLMIVSKDNHEALGFVYNYDTSPWDAITFLCTYISSTNRGRKIGVEANALFLRYLFDYFPFRKVYADVFEFNDISKTFVKEYGFVQEGYFSNHRYYQGRHWALLRLALNRERWTEVEQRVFPIQKPT